MKHTILSLFLLLGIASAAFAMEKKHTKEELANSLPENIVSLKNIVIGQFINHGYTTPEAYSTIHSILEEKDVREKAIAHHQNQEQTPFQSTKALKHRGFTQIGVSRITQQLFQIANNCGIDRAKELFSKES